MSAGETSLKDVGSPIFYVHVGHGKTGSTYLQHTLDRSRDALGAAGFDYPSDRKLARHKDGAPVVTMGNGAALDSIEALRRFLDQHPARERHLIVSSEIIFARLTPVELLFGLPELAAEAGYGRVEILLCIRDPISLTSAKYTQRLKTGKVSGDILSVMDELLPVRTVAELLRRKAESPATVTIHNYSRGKDRIIAEMADWLGIDPAVLTLPDHARVNRSLDTGERALMKALNGQFGRAASAVGAALVEALPEHPVEPYVPSVAEQDAIWRSIEGEIEAANHRLPEEARYRCDIVRDVPEQLPILTPAQLDIAAKALREKVLPALMASESPPAPTSNDGILSRLGRRARRVLGLRRGVERGVNPKAP